MDVVIVSQDSDFYQLITDNVSILRYRGKNTAIWDASRLQEKFGILPCQYAAFKALTGDASDNIRGADRIGPKTAGELMRQFGDLQTLLANPDAIRKPSVRESVIRNEPRIRKNYRLIRLDEAEELPFAPEQLRWQDRKLTTAQVLKEIGLQP